MADEPDYSIYLDKEPTDLQERFVPWLIEKVGYDPNGAKTKAAAFAAGVRLAVSLRIPFQASPENREATEQRRVQRDEERNSFKLQREQERDAKAAERERLAAEKAEARAAKAAEKAIPAEDDAPAKPAKAVKATPAATPAKATAAAGRGRRGARPAAAAATSPF
jgi:hypothetical protein